MLATLAPGDKGTKAFAQGIASPLAPSLAVRFACYSQA
ncbi:unnamed protein product, partial [marine sediment metagenome]